MTKIYTNDESDVEYRESYNKTDAAVKREKILKFAAKIRVARAQKEREMMLDAYNFLNNK